jgi:hypothetical protein
LEHRAASGLLDDVAKDPPARRFSLPTAMEWASGVAGLVSMTMSVAVSTTETVLLLSEVT